jgi:PKD repeat protein
MKKHLLNPSAHLISSYKTLLAPVLTGILFVASFVNHAEAQTAAFTPSATEACTPTTIYFTDLSTGTITTTTYYWDFGNSNYATIKNPSANYPQAGTYSVTLTLDKGLGTESKAYATIYVYPKPAPTVSALVTGCYPFTGAITAVATPVHVNAFTISGTFPAPAISYVGSIDGGTAVSYNWFFFDDLPTVNTGSNPVISLTNIPVGIYDVLLTVTDNKGCSKTVFIPNVLTVNPTPVASFTYLKQNPCSFGNVDFYGSALTGGTYEWKIDGTIQSTSQNFTYNFPAIGTYTVTYKVTSAENCPSNTVTETIIFNTNTPPDFGYSGACKGQPTNFTDAISTNVSAWAWDFDNNGTVDATVQNPTYTYAASGVYAAKLTKTFTDGCVLVTTKQVTIKGAAVSFLNGTPYTCSPIVFTSTTVPYPGETITGYSWDFNGTIITGTGTPTYSYSAPGTYSVTLTVTTSDGCTGSVTSNLVVTNGTTAAFTNSSPVKTCAPATFTSTTTPNPGATLSTWAWDFGNDGSTEATSAATTYTYTTPGTFPVKLTVTYTDGTYTCTTSTVSDIVVTSGTVASYTNSSPVTTCSPATFTSTTTPAPGSTITGYAWDFGDPASGGANTSALSNASHTYTEPGTYPVTLTVTSTNGTNTCTSSTVSNVGVTSGTVTDFSIGSPTYSCKAIAFASTTVPAPGTTITGYSWTFDEPTSGTNSSTLSSPSHTFAAPGNYAVTLTETTFDGTNYCTSSKLSNVVVTDGTIADFAFPDPAYTCDLLTFTSTSTTYSGNSITLLEWDFDEDLVTDATGTTVTHRYNTSGTQVVTLAVTTSDGCKRSISYDVEITNQTIAEFGYSQPTSCSPMVFTSTSTTYAGATITGYSWNFNGTIVSGTATETFSFATPGTYSVTLTVTNSDGCTDDQLYNVVVPALSPVNFNISPANGCINLTSNFTPVYSNALDPITGYSWVFGDPTSGTNTSTLSTPSHIYTAAGTYTVTLTVTTTLGCTLTRTNTVRAGTPQAVIALVGGTYCQSTQADYVATITTLTDQLVWDFGDGNGATQTVSGQSTSTISHSY